MLVTVSDGDQFDFVFDENDYGFYKIFIKVTNINDLIVFQSEQMYHKAFESFWVIPPGYFDNYYYSFRVEIYKLGTLCYSQDFEKTGNDIDVSKLEIKNHIYEIQPLCNINELNKCLYDDTICIIQGMDCCILREIFIGNCYYKLIHSDIYKDSIVLDIGSNCGFFSLFAVNKGAKKVYAFDPVRDMYTLTLYNTRDFRDNIIPFNVGTGDKNEWKSIGIDWMGQGVTTQIDHSGIPDWFVSATKDNFWHTENINNNYYAEFWTSNSIFERLNLSDVDIIKVDCEGAEFDFFECLDDKYLENIKLILCEWHIPIEIVTDKKERYLNIKNRLEKNGFVATSDNNVEDVCFVEFYQKESSIINNYGKVK